MKYKIMRFVANRNYEGQDIEVQKISKGNNTLIDLILKLTKKFDAFVTLQEKNWSKQRKVNEKIEKRLDNLVKKNKLKE